MLFRQLTQLVECFAYNEKDNGSNPLLFKYSKNIIDLFYSKHAIQVFDIFNHIINVFYKHNRKIVYYFEIERKVSEEMSALRH